MREIRRQNNKRNDGRGRMGKENISYLFDVDGTLTSPQRCMSTDHTMKFLSWMGDKDVYIVAGSGIEKVEQQIANSILKRLEGIFCSMANDLYWILSIPSIRRGKSIIAMDN